MLATIALGAAQVRFYVFISLQFSLCFSLFSFQSYISLSISTLQSPWGVATGAITGHLIATTIAILGGAFLANYISEKLVGA